VALKLDSHSTPSRINNPSYWWQNNFKWISI